MPEEAPAPQWREYERLARDGLALLTAGACPDCVALRAQIAEPVIKAMDYTGAGFFASLELSSDAPELQRSGILGDVHATGPDGTDPLGLLLFVENGRAQALEVFAYGDWPDDISGYSCHYVRWRPTSDTSAAAEVAVERDFTSMWSPK